jgi:hypothetical protein
MEWKHLKEANLQGPVVMSGIIILMAKRTVLCLGLIWAMYNNTKNIVYISIYIYIDIYTIFFVLLPLHNGDDAP